MESNRQAQHPVAEIGCRSIPLLACEGMSYTLTVPLLCLAAFQFGAYSGKDGTRVRLHCQPPGICILENVEHCGGEPEQAATMATCT